MPFLEKDHKEYRPLSSGDEDILIQSIDLRYLWPKTSNSAGFLKYIGTLAVNVILTSVSCLVVLLVWNTVHFAHSQPQCGLPTDSLFGNIPWKTKILENDENFIATYPGFIDGPNSTSIWSSLYPSAWVAVHNPAAVGFGGGVDLSTNSENPSVWEEGFEGFGVAVMHQMHCVALIKRALLDFRREGASNELEEHQDHCVEYLRQAVMCSGDLTLERPESPSYPQKVTGWGNEHRCRDFDAIVSAVRERAIQRGPNGWERINYGTVSEAVAS